MTGLKHAVAAVLALILAVSCAATTHSPADPRPAFNSSYYSGVSETLTPFGTEQAFLDYVDRWDERGEGWRFRQRFLSSAELPSTAKAQVLQDVDCSQLPPGTPGCEDETASEDRIVVTGARIATSMTNNQVGGVDEGGIVKRIGDRVIVLRDGRLFILNIGDGIGEPPRLESRIDLYQDPDEDTWFDELLVSDKRIVVIAYSYQYDASSYSVLELDDQGRVTPIGRFLMRSEDYFDGQSYAARMVDDAIIFEAPIALDAFQSGSTGLSGFFKPDADGDGALDGFTPIFDLADVYRPVADIAYPMVQVVARCDLERLVHLGPEAACLSTAFVTNQAGQLYVGEETAYFWAYPERHPAIFPEDCQNYGYIDLGPAAVYRITLADMDLSVAAGFGAVNNPFWMHEWDDDLFAFTVDVDDSCQASRRNSAVYETHNLVEIPQEAFSRTYQAATRSDDWRQLPEIAARGTYEVRFLSDKLVYGRRAFRRWRIEGRTPGVVGIVDLEHNQAPGFLALSHGVERIEAADESNAIVIGRSQPAATGFSLLNLNDPVRTLSSVSVSGRVPAESRSHAFNSTEFAFDGGSGDRGFLMGLATMRAEQADSPFWSWETYGAGISFLAYEGWDAFRLVGHADPKTQEPHEDYACEVSCVDWYGATRPFFINNRVFALTDTELIEVDLLGQEALVVLNRTRLDMPPDETSSR